MTENLPNLKKNTHLHIQEVQQNLSRISTKCPTLKYITVKMLKAKRKGKCRSSRIKEIITYKRTTIKITTNFSSEIT